VGSELEWENRGIDGPNVLQAVDLQLGVDDTSLVPRQHREGIRGVELRLDVTGNKRIDLIVRIDGLTMADLCAEGIT